MTQIRKFALVLLLPLMLFGRVEAATDTTTLTSDINNLIVQGNDLLVEMSKTSLTTLSMGTALESLETSVGNYTNNVIAVYNTLDGSSSMSLTSELLISMQTLSSTSLAISTELVALSNTIITLAPVTMLTTLDSSLTAMLRLSTDIGTMADRIGEMADRILVMADNIGVMADRILATQIIQSDNLALTRDAILQTQKNTLALISMFSL